jgi:hypothetical protein
MFVPVQLTPFSNAQARRLITEPVKDIYSYDDEAVTHIVETSSGLPHRIQQLCLEIIHYLQSTPRRTNITVEDVDTVLQKIHWLDQEIDDPGETVKLPLPDQAPIIAETTAPYNPKDQEDENPEEE